VQEYNRAEAFLTNPQGLSWSELVPSDVVIVDVDGNKIEGTHNVEPTAFFIHGRIHKEKKNAACIMHTHMPFAMRFYNRVAYDSEYGGLALNSEEGDRICSKLAQADVLFMANHGVLICGESVASVFDDMYYLERACTVQVLAQSTGRPLRRVPEAVALRTARQFEAERQQSRMHLEALKKTLERLSPGWSEL
jgi:ribulose-5-phosphate 4-epimerase/fuculose-1-phosphate aldolase